ncbi:hypothetical protein KM043_018155 [Ampulex compressa]|nr:hypothetical protein KM043_018155 [Ampulex compressa]
MWHGRLAIKLPASSDKREEQELHRDASSLGATTLAIEGGISPAFADKMTQLVAATVPEDSGEVENTGGGKDRSSYEQVNRLRRLKETLVRDRRMVKGDMEEKDLPKNFR